MAATLWPALALIVLGIARQICGGLIAAALADYRLYASDGQAFGETFLYARAGLISDARDRLDSGRSDPSPDDERSRLAN